MPLNNPNFSGLATPDNKLWVGMKIPIGGDNGAAKAAPFEFVLDTLTKDERSKRMSLIKNKDTKPELQVRRALHRLGYRYRLHAKELPGKPDMVFSSRKKIIFVHGCFWHRHSRCGLARLPKSKFWFWVPKLDRNRQRDRKNIRKLRRLGWTIRVVWECELNTMTELIDSLVEFLG